MGRAPWGWWKRQQGMERGKQEEEKEEQKAKLAMGRAG